tara:strand:- start:20130 stop:20945 length:816 start_codon:yes stop_codon:yes gene_type:complete
MKIVCLIRSGAPLNYFVNKINSEHKVYEVIIEQPRSNNKKKISRFKKITFKKLYNFLKSRFIKNHKAENIYNNWFSNNWKKLNKTIPYIEVENINSESVLNRIKEINPDLIIVHGTSIVKNHIIESSKLALNLHWGLSPYYRGTHCTDWALINWDPYNIGVTIHKLTNEIDGGDILAQKRAKIKSNDTLLSINMQLTYLGVELINQAIKKIKRKEEFFFQKQNFSIGYLTYKRQWNFLLSKQIDFIEKNNLIKKMLNKPSRKVKLPIIEML